MAPSVLPSGPRHTLGALSLVDGLAQGGHRAEVCGPNERGGVSATSDIIPRTNCRTRNGDVDSTGLSNPSRVPFSQIADLARRRGSCTSRL